jgi:hypothetical protein
MSHGRFHDFNDAHHGHCMEMMWRHWLFVTGDFVLIASASAVAAVVMSHAHGFFGGFWIPSITGMAAGMAAAMVLGFAARPLLGSIETSVPVMLGGMASGMAVCLTMFVLHIGTVSAATLGLIAGAAVHAHLRRMETRVRTEGRAMLELEHGS